MTRLNCLRWLARQAVCTACALGLLLGLLPPASAATLQDVQARGELVVGVKMDGLLWGQLDTATGRIVGLEPDLAQRMADELGVKLRLVGVLTAERVEAVRSGRVDVLIATLSDTPERARLLDLVRPNYYSSGANLLTRKKDHFRAWADLKNRRVCGRRGAFWNRAITVQYGIDIIALYSNDWSQAAMRDGRCAALLHDDTIIAAMLQDPAVARDFEMPLPTVHSAPWSIALAPDARGGALERRLSDLVVRWHRNGDLLALERKWGIPETRFLLDKHDVWSRRSGAGWYCGATVTPTTPKECL
ncbi:MAG: transporter substrate-binding domain-containing protein [Ramlibacter sp.]|nr:transporter substrate-binding domain-containing protein [Ramlibacter sp.]MCW5650901.1 transporter substrate-binding domain-containing protein [Ramlibacter sp.]